MAYVTYGKSPYGEQKANISYTHESIVGVWALLVPLVTACIALVPVIGFAAWWAIRYMIVHQP